MPTIEEYYASLAAEYATATGQGTYNQGTITPPTFYGGGGLADPIGPSGRTYQQITGTQYLSDAERAWYLSQGDVSQYDAEAQRFLYDYGNQQMYDEANRYATAMGPLADPAFNAQQVDPYVHDYYEDLNNRYVYGQAAAQMGDAITATRPSPTLREMALYPEEFGRTYEQPNVIGQYLTQPIAEAYRTVRDPLNEAWQTVRPYAVEGLTQVGRSTLPGQVLDTVGRAAPVIPDVRQTAELATPRTIEELLLELTPFGAAGDIKRAAELILNNPTLLRRVAQQMGKSVDEVAQVARRLATEERGSFFLPDRQALDPEVARLIGLTDEGTSEAAAAGMREVKQPLAQKPLGQMTDEELRLTERKTANRLANYERRIDLRAADEGYDDPQVLDMTRQLDLMEQDYERILDEFQRRERLKNIAGAVSGGETGALRIPGPGEEAARNRLPRRPVEPETAADLPPETQRVSMRDLMSTSPRTETPRPGAGPAERMLSGQPPKVEDDLMAQLEASQRMLQEDPQAARQVFHEKASLEDLRIGEEKRARGAVFREQEILSQRAAKLSGQPLEETRKTGRRKVFEALKEGEEGGGVIPEIKTAGLAGRVWNETQGAVGAAIATKSALTPPIFRQGLTRLVTRPVQAMNEVYDSFANLPWEKTRDLMDSIRGDVWVRNTTDLKYPTVAKNVDVLGAEAAGQAANKGYTWLDVGGALLDPLGAEDLAQLTKADLEGLARNSGVKLAGNETKEQLVTKLTRELRPEDLQGLTDSYVGRWVRRTLPIKLSDRQMAVMLNLMRTNWYSEVAQNMWQAGERNIEAYTRLRRLIEHATQRGSLSQPGGFPFFFSTRALSGRVQLAGDLLQQGVGGIATGRVLRPGAEQEAARILAGMTAFGSAFIGIPAALGIGDIEWNDGLPILRIGRQRFDPWAGWNTIAKLMHRTAQDVQDVLSENDWEDVPQETWQRIADRAVDFLRGGLSPAVGRGVDIATGKDFLGRPYNLADDISSGNILLETFAPFLVSEIIEAYRVDGVKGASLSVPFAIGSLSQNAYVNADDIARAAFGESAKFYEYPPHQQAQANIEAINKGLPVDDWQRTAPYRGATNGALRYVQEQMGRSPDFSQKISDALSSVRMDEFDISEYTVIWEAEADFIRMAKERGATSKQADKAWRAFFNTVLDLDSITRKMREAAYRVDPGIREALENVYESGQRDWLPPDWMYEGASAK